MNRESTQSAGVRMGLLTILALLGALGGILASGGPARAHAGAKPNRYLGVGKCKVCHRSEAAGNQYGVWLAAKHSKAYQNLASAEAKRYGQERGVEDPQKSEKCLKCHTTGYGKPEELFKRGFDPKKGVQCESCHGPGELHQKARFREAADEAQEEEGPSDDEAPRYVQIPDDEILKTVPQKTCLGCHNEESPSFERFCYYEFMGKIRHLDPRKVRGPEDIQACGCGDRCRCDNGCPDSGCGVPSSTFEREK